MEQFILHDQPLAGTEVACDNNPFRPWSHTARVALEELEQVRKPFVRATVFLSGEPYATVSALPPLVNSLQKATQST